MTRKPKLTDHPHIAEPLRSLATPIDQLKADPKNARRHGEQNLRAIRSSLERFGQRRPVVVNRTTGEIEAGHGVVEAARQLGWLELAVLWVEDDPATARGFALADNRTAELGEWDDSVLQELVDTLDRESPDLVADLAREDLLGGDGDTKLRPVDVQTPPAMAWVLIGIPTVRFGEIAQQVEAIAGVEGTVVESTANDG